MAYGSSKPPGPKLEVLMDDLLPHRTMLKDGSRVVLQRILSSTSASSSSPATDYSDPRTIRSVHALLNYEISQGNSYPFEEALNEEKFMEYFFGYDAFVLRTVDAAAGRPGPSSGGLSLEDPQLVGCFYIKPNYPGRSSHLCNGGFLVAPAFRGSGAGLILGERFRVLAQRLGYRGSVFNLVFHDNPASLRLWEKLDYHRVGVLPGAGRHPVVPGKTSAEDGAHYVDATLWYHDLTKPLKRIVLPWEKVDHSEKNQTRPSSHL